MAIPRWRFLVSELQRTPRLLLLQKVLRHMPVRPVVFAKLCFLRLEDVPRVPPKLLRGSAAVRRGTIEDLPGLLQLRDKADVFRSRFAAGDHCVVALSGGRIVGYEWFCEQPVYHEEDWDLRIEIPNGFVYAYDAHIDPAYRNTGVWLRFKAFLGEWMTATGKCGVLTFVDYSNWPSLRTHIRFGFTPFESVFALNVLGVKLSRKLPAISSTARIPVICALPSRGAMLARPLHAGLGSARAHGAIAHTIARMLFK